MDKFLLVGHLGTVNSIKWPIHCHLHLLINRSMGNWPVCRRSSSFKIVSSESWHRENKCWKSLDFSKNSGAHFACTTAILEYRNYDNIVEIREEQMKQRSETRAGIWKNEKKKIENNLISIGQASKGADLIVFLQLSHLERVCFFGILTVIAFFARLETPQIPRIGERVEVASQQRLQGLHWKVSNGWVKVCSSPHPDVRVICYIIHKIWGFSRCYTELEYYVRISCLSSWLISLTGQSKDPQTITSFSVIRYTISTERWKETVFHEWTR